MKYQKRWKYHKYDNSLYTGERTLKPQLSIDQMYQTIEQEIVNLRIKPNEILSENSLAQRFEVSRTPVRSILQRLQENGFVRIIPGKGTFVEPIDIEIATQMIYLRTSVETMVLRDFIRTATPTDVESVRYALVKLEEAANGAGNLDTFDINFFLKEDMDMHRIWFSTMKKLYIWDMLMKPHPDYSRFIRLDIVGAKNVPDVITEHRMIMDLIDNRSTDGIEELISRHLYGGIRRLGSKLFSDEYRTYFQSAF